MVDRWDSVLDSSRPPFYRWFPGGKVNTCYNALDLHIAQGRSVPAGLNSQLFAHVHSWPCRARGPGGPDLGQPRQQEPAQVHLQGPSPAGTHALPRPPPRSGVDCRLVCLAHPHHTHKVTHFAGVLANTHGVEKGDRVLIYMPMIPQGNPAAPRSCALSRRCKP